MSSSSSSSPQNSSSDSDSNSNSDPSSYLHLPDECWESVFKHLHQNPIYLETLSLVSTQFLSITNRTRSSLNITKQSLSILNSLLLRFQNITTLSFKRFQCDLNVLLPQIASSELPKLQSLDISRQITFPSEGLRSFSRKFPTLKSLKCSHMFDLLNMDLLLIGDCFPDLEELDISYLLDCTGSFIIDHYDNYTRLNDPVMNLGVVKLISGLKKLRKVNLTGNPFLRQDSILSICNCEFLEELAFEGHVLSPSGIAIAIRARPQLRSLGVIGIGFGINSLSSEFVDALLSLKGLTCVDLSHSRISDELLCAIAEAGLPLRKLVLEGCSNFSYGGISCLLMKCGPLLQHLDLKNVKFLSDECVVELSLFLGGLISVNLGGNLRVTNSSFFTIVRNCRLITEILMESTGVGKQKVEEDSLMGLVENSHVKSLFLGNNSWLNDESVQMFASFCPNLERLDLYSSRGVSNGVVQVLKRCCKIRHLNLHSSGLKTWQIDFPVPSLLVLDLKWLRIGDEALSEISKNCHRLLQLELEGCQNITAKGVKQVVENCKQLKIINLKSCDKVAAHVVTWMVFARPSLRKIVTPPQFQHTERQRELYERHGCLISGNELHSESDLLSTCVAFASSL